MTLLQEANLATKISDALSEFQICDDNTLLVSVQNDIKAARSGLDSLAWALEEINGLLENDSSKLGSIEADLKFVHLCIANTLDDICTIIGRIGNGTQSLRQDDYRHTWDEIVTYFRRMGDMPLVARIDMFKRFVLALCHTMVSGTMATDEYQKLQGQIRQLGIVYNRGLMQDKRIEGGSVELKPKEDLSYEHEMQSDSETSSPTSPSMTSTTTRSTVDHMSNIDGKERQHWATYVFASISSTYLPLTDEQSQYHEGQDHPTSVIPDSQYEEVLWMSFLPGIRVSLHCRPADMKTKMMLGLLDAHGRIAYTSLSVNMLRLRRSGCMLQFYHPSRDRRTNIAWVSLRFSTIERLVLFACTFVAMQSQSGTPLQHPYVILDDQSGDEVERYRGKIHHAKNYLLLIMYHDQASRAVRLQATRASGMRAGEPVWTAFITHPITSSSWCERVDDCAILLNELQPKIFQFKHNMNKTSSGAHILTFTSSSDAKAFMTAVNELRISALAEKAPGSLSLGIETDDISDVSSIESVPSLVTGSISDSDDYDFEAEEQLVTIFCEDVALKSMYQTAKHIFDIETFHASHDRLLKIFFKNLRMESLNNNQVNMIRWLRREDRRNRITTRMQQIFWMSNIDEKQAVERLRSQERDRKQLLRKKMGLTERADLLVGDDDSDSVSSDGSSSDDVSNRDHARQKQPTSREVGDALQNLELFIKRSRAFTSFKTQLKYSLTPATTLPEAIASHDVRVIQRFLTRDFTSITSADYEWLHELHTAGYSMRELSELLLENENDSPWIYFSPQKILTQPLRFDCHVLGCAHGEVNSERSSTLTLDLKFQTASHDSVDVRRKAEELCGIAGIAPNSRETDQWHGTLHFQDSMTTSRITYASDSTKQTNIGRWSRLSTILTNLMTAVAVVQNAGLCCNSFTVIYRFPDRLELCQIPFRLLKEMNDILKVVIQQSGSLQAVQQCSAQAKRILLDHEEICNSTINHDPLSICALAIQFVCVAFLSYLQAHIGAIKPFFMDTPQRRLVLLGNQDLIAQSGIEASLVEMTCLSGMTRERVLAFSAITRPSSDLEIDTHRYHVLANAEDLLDTWGPGHLLHDSAHRTIINAIAIGGGIISSVKGTPLTFHWTKGLTFSGPCATFSSTEKILVGAVVDINRTCDIDGRLSRDCSSCALENLSTHGPFWNLRQRQGGFQGGQYVNATFIQVWDKIPGRSLKEYLLEQSSENIIYYLDQNWGLQVSFCTSVARRVPLRQLIADLLPEFVNILDRIMWQELVDTHDIINAFTDGEIYEWLSQLPDKYRSYVLKMIHQILEQLRNTGLDRQVNALKIAWPQQGDFRGLQIPCATETYWASILDDSEDCATFAYVTTRCLETSLVRCQGGLKAWQNVSKMLITEMSQYRLEGYSAVSPDTAHVVSLAAAAKPKVTTATGTTNTPMITRPTVAFNEWRLRNQEVYYIKKFDKLLRGKVERPAADAPHLLIGKSTIPRKIWDRVVAKEESRRNHYIREKQMAGDHAEWVVVRSSIS